MAATGDGKESGAVQKFPGPVTCDDDDPKKGFFTIHLSVPEIKKKFGQNVAKNGDVKKNFTTGSISVTIDCNSKSGDCHQYFYERRLPLDIDPDKSDHKIKDGGVQLNLCKAKKSESWAAHVKMFIKKEA